MSMGKIGQSQQTTLALQRQLYDVCLCEVPPQKGLLVCEK